MTTFRPQRCPDGMTSKVLALLLLTPICAPHVNEATRRCTLSAEEQEFDWCDASTPDDPSARSAAGMAYDSFRHVTVMFGGAVATTGGYTGSQSALDETWEWNGTTWTRKHPEVSPPARIAPGMVFDSVRGVVVVFGGSSETPNTHWLGDTWEWDGANWTERTLSVHPPARSYGSLSYDSSRRNVFLFGGWCEPNPCTDTWTWDGADWQEAMPPHTPPIKEGAWGGALAYDPVHAVMLQFGADIIGNYFYSNVWQWDGSDWSAIRTGMQGGPRGAAVVFNAARSSFMSVNDSTLEWNGENWIELHPSKSPPSPAGQFPVAYDSDRGVVVMVGFNGGPEGRTWEFGRFARSR